MKTYLMIYLSILLLLPTKQGLAQNKRPCLEIEVNSGKTLILYKEDIASMKRTSVKFNDFSGLEYFYSGVSFQDILQQAGISFSSGKENLVKYVLAKGADGSEALFSIAELDTTLSERKIIVADNINGRSLPEGLGPFRIVVSGEENRVRWLWELNSLIVRSSEE